MSKYSDKLRLMANYLDDGKYMAAQAMTFFSPAGDGMGCDNTCIDMGNNPNEPMDIQDAINELIRHDKNRAIREKNELVAKLQQEIKELEEK